MVYGDSDRTGQGKLPQELVTDNALLKRKYESEELGGAEPVLATPSAWGLGKGFSLGDVQIPFNACPATVLNAGFLGDSITKQCFDVPSSGYGGNSATDSAFSNYGWLAWMIYFGGLNLRATKYAVAGATSGPTGGGEPSNVLTLQLPAALAARHDIYFLCPIGINDTALSGAQSAANVRSIVEEIVSAGRRIVLGAPTPTNSYSTSKGRISTIINEMRALAAEYPTMVRFVDFHTATSDPNDVADGSAYQSVFDDGTYDTTHPSVLNASYMGWLAYEGIRDWLAPYRAPVCAGDAAINFAANPRLGGTSGTISNAETNSVAPTSWTVSRGAASVTYGAYKARRTPLLWKTGITYPVGARIAPATPNGVHYIVLTSAAAGATAPSATTLWGQSTPDVGGPVYLTVPANDAIRTPTPGEDFVIDFATTGTSAADYVQITQDISAASLVGKTLRAGISQEILGSPFAGAHIRLQQLNGASAKIKDHFAMGLNSFFGNSTNPYAFPHRNSKGLVVTPEFVVDPACVTIKVMLRVFGAGASTPIRVAYSDFFLA